MWEVAWAASLGLPGLSAGLRLLGGSSAGDLPAGTPRQPKRLLAVVPARDEGPLLHGIVGDLIREALRTPDVELRAVVVLDGDELSDSGLPVSEHLTVLQKAAGRSKAEVLEWFTRQMDELRPGELDACNYVFVFDADSRLPEGWLGRLRVPAGCDVVQLRIETQAGRLEGVGGVAELSLNLAMRVEEPDRDARALPVRLRGKGMGFSPRTWRAGPGRGAATVAEDSEVWLRLLARGHRVRFVSEPPVLEPSENGWESMARPRARWFAGNLHVLLRSARDVLRIGLARPAAALVLLDSLLLRPRALVVAFQAISVMVAGCWLLVSGRLALLAPLMVAAAGLTLEAVALERGRKRLHEMGLPSSIRARDVGAFCSMWLKALGIAILAPRRWHRARPKVSTVE